jgi:predicted secreted protein
LRPSTASFTRSGHRSFRTIQKECETQIIDATLTVSDDGRTLTDEATAEGGVRRTWVLDRVQ